MASPSKPYRPPAAADFYVNTVPGLVNSTSLQIFAGYLPARSPVTYTSNDPEDDAHLYFLLEKARHLPPKRRLVMWLNGGPGCSSFDGVMMEIGSFRPNLRATTGQDPLEWTTPGGAWNEYTDVLFLDQPVGTGFSYVANGAYAKSLKQAAEDVSHFLRRFVEVWPEYGKDSGTEFYIAGESFAGQYIPFTAHELLNDPSTSVNLVGIAIGNGAMDPLTQGGSELPTLLETGTWKEGTHEVDQLRQLTIKCEEAKKKVPKGKRPQTIEHCEGLLQNVIELSQKNEASGPTCINIYDVRLRDPHPACGMKWPPTLDPTYSYLKRKDVLKAFHVDTIKHPEAWIECSHRVGGALHHDDEPASVTFLPDILAEGIKVLLFAGDKDLICNHIGVERMIDDLEWAGQKGWGSSPPPVQDWIIASSPAGTFQTRSGLTYVKIYNASHMVGFDAPVAAHDMMLRFMDVDVKGAAGPSLSIESSLKGGSTIGGVTAGMGSTIDGKTKEQLMEEAKWAAYYNAGSAALVVLLLLVATGTCILLRLRRKQRRLGATSRRSNGGSGPVHLSSTSGSPSDEALELERLVEEGREEDDEDGGRPPRYADARGTSLVDKGKGRQRSSPRTATRPSEEHKAGESLFDVGDDED